MLNYEIEKIRVIKGKKNKANTNKSSKPGLIF